MLIYHPSRSGLSSLAAAVIVRAMLAAASALGVAAGTINFQIQRLVDDPPSSAHTLAFLVCLLPVFELCAAAAWAYLERAGLVYPMATPVRISGSEVEAAAQRNMLLFPMKGGGTEERTM